MTTWSNDPSPLKRSGKTFIEKINETKRRRSKLMGMMEETLKAKFDDRMQDEAVEVEKQNKMQKL